MLLQHGLQVLHHLTRPSACQVRESLHLRMHTFPHQGGSCLTLGPARLATASDLTHNASRPSRATTS